MTGPFTTEKDIFKQETAGPAQSQYVLISRSTYNQLRRQLFYLWTYMIQEDSWEEAIEFMEDHCEVPTPFDMVPYEIPYTAEHSI